ncbi:hypothetical protein MNBD_GAMMA23-1271 [hydrothermal vent metagenome]|uniref:Coenzyme Q-binding protein COQ10 START domain-containing protein n=1 Tax=hydrothermal vent metagenome TaxID=652676 RepID=A0A3B1A6E0_9ZZZZ
MHKHPNTARLLTKKVFTFNILFTFFLLVQSPSIQAGQIIKAFVDQQGEHFLINLEMQLDAPKNIVYQLLTDYAHLHQLSDSIQSSKILHASPRTTKIKMVSEGCILFFCQTITQVQNVHELDNGYIHIHVEPALSNLKINTQLWHIEALDKNRTRVHYSADIVPDFWIPPLIGGWLFQTKLLEEATNLINNTEKIANPKLALPQIPPMQIRYTAEPDTQQSSATAEQEHAEADEEEE